MSVAFDGILKHYSFKSRMDFYNIIRLYIATHALKNTRAHDRCNGGKDTMQGNDDSDIDN